MTDGAGRRTPPSPLGLARALAWSAAGDLGSKVALVVVAVVASRLLPPTGFAAYIALLAASVVAAAAWDAGVSTLVNLERSQAHAPLRALAGRVAHTRALTLPVWLATYALAVAILGRVADVRPADAAGFAAVSLVSSIQLPLLSALRGDLRFRVSAVALGAGRWATVAVAIVLLAGGSGTAGPGQLATAHLAGELVVLGLLGLAVRRSSGIQDPGWTTDRLTVRRALPFAANSLLNIAYNRLDVIVVAGLVSIGQLAAYAPASRIQDALYLLPTAIGAVSLPYLARLVEVGDSSGSLRMLRRLWGIGLALTIPAAVALTIGMPAILDVLLGPAYAPAAAPARILAWSMVVAVIGGPVLAYLIAMGRGADTTKAFAAAFATSLALHLSLDWWLGALGAAIASFTRDLANLAVAGWLARRAYLRASAQRDESDAGRRAALVNRAVDTHAVERP